MIQTAVSRLILMTLLGSTAVVRVTFVTDSLWLARLAHHCGSWSLVRLSWLTQVHHSILRPGAIRTSTGNTTSDPALLLPAQTATARTFVARDLVTSIYRRYQASKSFPAIMATHRVLFR